MRLLQAPIVALVCLTCAPPHGQPATPTPPPATPAPEPRAKPAPPAPIAPNAPPPTNTDACNCSLVCDCHGDVDPAREEQRVRAASACAVNHEACPPCGECNLP
ncbi:MAG TPA: hypothetical protein VMJ10_17465 [Kofleriaceae bacterium]|nr:hypothetical protein [Kofleriaceae bacterium]